MSALLNNCNPSSSHCMHAAGVGGILDRSSAHWHMETCNGLGGVSELAPPTLGSSFQTTNAWIHLPFHCLALSCMQAQFRDSSESSFSKSLVQFGGGLPNHQENDDIASIFSSGEENARETDILKGSEYQCFSVEVQGLLRIFSFREVKETNKRGGSQRRKCHRF